LGEDTKGTWCEEHTASKQSCYYKCCNCAFTGSLRLPWFSLGRLRLQVGTLPPRSFYAYRLWVDSLSPVAYVGLRTMH